MRSRCWSICLLLQPQCLEHVAIAGAAEFISSMFNLEFGNISNPVLTPHDNHDQVGFHFVFQSQFYPFSNKAQGNVSPCPIHFLKDKNDQSPGLQLIEFIYTSHCWLPSSMYFGPCLNDYLKLLVAVLIYNLLNYELPVNPGSHLLCQMLLFGVS